MPTAQPPFPAAPRSVAIDVMRGLTLALMIVVNMSISEATAFAPLLHATWHGLTLTDVVFPSFLFVVGAAMSYTLPRYQAIGAAAVWRKVAQRTALIFLCGYLLYWFPFVQFDAAGHLAMRPLSGTRILGVLQRIALAYGIASLLLHHGGQRAAVVYSVLALLGSWWVMAHFGDYTLQGNAGLRLDRWLLGEAHLYKGEGIPFDPEGVLGTFPAVVQVLAGFGAARLVQQGGASLATVGRLMVVGTGCVLLAAAWHGLLPINKKLWTSSYVVCTIGIDLLVLAVLVWLIDLRRPGRAAARWTWFFEVFGRNTLFIYLLSELVSTVLWLTPVAKQPAFEWLYTAGFRPWAGVKSGGLAYALAFMLACWLVAWAMDRRKLYIKL